MHYYQHHIGDFQRDTANLSDLDAIAYLRLIWMYYDTEKPLPNDPRKLAFRIGSDADRVQILLETFFTLSDGVWIQKRCDAEIAKYHAKAEAARNANKIRWGLGKDQKSDPDQILTNKPITNISSTNVEDIEATKKKRATQLAEDFAASPGHVELAKKCGVSLDDELVKFKDHFRAKGTTMKDWNLAFNNWLRRSPEFGREKPKPKSGGYVHDLSKMNYELGEEALWPRRQPAQQIPTTWTDEDDDDRF